MQIESVEAFQFFLSQPLNIIKKPLILEDSLTFINSNSSTRTAYCLDNFESELKLSERLLIRYDNNLILLQAKNVLLLKQTCPSKWQFISQLEAGEIKENLSNCSPIRAFLAAKENSLRIDQYLLLDENEKTTARCTIYSLENTEHSIIFGVTQALRGYDAEHQLLKKVLLKQNAIALQSYTEIYLKCGFDKPIYTTKPKLSIVAKAPVIETTNTIISEFIKIARENEFGIKADYDSEFLHDYRVSLRKVRSVLSLFKGVYSETETLELKQQFSQIMRSTNRLRDLDVYLLDKKEYFDLLPERMYIGLDYMFDAFTQERKKQLQSVVKVLNNKNYPHQMQLLQNKFTSLNEISTASKATESSLSFATKLIWKRYTKVCLIARKINDTTADEEVHQLRIQCKKLRYLMEFFASLFPQKMLKELIKSLKSLQDRLGRFNDFSVQQESLQDFLSQYAKKHHSKKLIAMAESIGALIIVLLQKQQFERAQIIQAFIAFDSPEIREEFSIVFHHGVNE